MHNLHYYYIGLFFMLISQISDLTHERKCACTSIRMHEKSLAMCRAD